MKILKLHFICIALPILVSGTVVAQEIPEQLKSIFPKKDGKKRERLSLEKLTVAQQDFLTENTSKHSEGFLSVIVPPTYLDQLSNIDISRDLSPILRDSNASVMGLRLVGTRKEGPNRTAYFFGDRSGIEAMVTLWNYKKDKAAVVEFADFLNQSIDGMDGTLSLASHPSSTRGLWKMTANNDEVMYEIVLTDSITSDGPSMKATKGVSEMRKLISFARTAQ